MSGALALPPRRDRAPGRGLTAVIDFGPDGFGWTGEAGLGDLLACAGPYIDYAKIYAINSLLMPEETLRRIVDRYREAQVATFSGGILFEWAHRQGALADLPALLREKGIGGLEVSENYIRMDPAERDGHIARFHEAGFEVIYEFGRKTPDAPLSVQHLADIVGDVRAAGAAHVIVEQSEIDLAAADDPAILSRLAQQDWFAGVFVEMDPYRFPGQAAEVIQSLGAQVNLANIAPGQALRLEGLRRGIGRAVDYAMFDDATEREGVS